MFVKLSELVADFSVCVRVCVCVCGGGGGGPGVGGGNIAFLWTGQSLNPGGGKIFQAHSDWPHGSPSLQ